MKRLAAAVPRLLLLFALFSCTSDTTGPSAVRRAQLSLAPNLDRAVLAQVGVDRVLVRFTRTDGSKALESVVAFPAGSDTLNLAVSVPMIGVAEDFELTILLIDDPAADTVFRSGPSPVALRAGVTQPTVSVPPFLYAGTGAKATGVRLVAKPASVAFGQTATFTAEAFDASGTTIPGTPILWSTSDPAKASVPNAAVGAVVGGTTRGNVSVTASLLQTLPNTPPPSASSTLTVQPVATALVAVSGASQTGQVGAALAQPLRVRVNAADNLGVQGVPVSFTVTLGGGTLSTSQVLTDVNGDASALWTLGRLAGAQAVAATVTGVAGATQTFAAVGVAGAASKLAMTTNPSAVKAGVAIAPAVVVEAQDTFGNTATAFNGAITLALGVGPAGTTLGGTTTATAVNGIATFGDVTLSTVGTVTLVAASSGLTSVTSAPFTVSAGAAATLAFATQPSNGTAGTAIAPAIVVTARDIGGNTAASFAGAVSLSLSANPAGGALSGTTTVNAVGGVATFSGVTLAKAATGYALSATANGLTNATSTAFTIAPAAASVLAFTTQPSAVSAGVVIAPAVVVEAQDSFGNTVNTFNGPVTMTLGGSPAGATLGGGATVTAVNGVAKFVDLAVNSAGTGLTLAAASTGLTGATSAPFTVSAGAAATLVFTTQPSNSTAGSAIAPSVVVTARDASGNTAASFVGAVSLALGTSQTGGVLSGTTTVNAVGGVATFSGVTLAKAAVGYTLSATASGLGSATSAAFTIAPAAASVLVFTTQPSAVNTGISIAPAVVVAAQDSFGNTVSTFNGPVTMALGVSPAGATLGGTATITAVNGIAQFADLTVSGAGTGFTLVAGSSGLASVTSAAFTVSATAPATLVFTAQPSNGTAGTAIAPSIVVTARDASGNTATSFVGAVSLALGTNPAGGVLSGTTTVNAVGGVATFSGVTLAKAAAGYALSAAAAGLTNATSATFTIAPAAASALVFTTQPSAVNAGAAITPAVVVQAQDSFGNAATTFTGAIAVAIASGPNGATLAGTTTVTAVNGVAQFADLTSATAGAGYTLAASSSGLTGATSAAFTVSAAAPATLVFTTQPSNGTAGTAIAPSIVVAARDASGNTATSFVGTVSLALGTNPGGGTLTGTTTVNAVGGVATFSGVTLTKAAAGYTLSATASGLGTASSGAFTIAPAAASALAFTTQPATSGAGAVITPPVGVTVLDAYGNVASAFSGNVGITIGANPGGASLVGTTTAAAAAGVASFANLSLTARGIGYTLVAAASGLTSATSTAFDITAITLSWTNPSGGLWSNPSNWSLGRVPQAADSVVIAQPGTYTVTLDTTFSGSVISLGASSGTQTLALTSRTLTISGTMVVKANGVFSSTSSSIAGAGALLNQGVLNFKATSVTATGGLDNQATVIANAAVTVTGPLKTSGASILRLLADGTTGFSTLTSSSSFTNNGLIELTSAGSSYSPTLAVAGSGTLTNASGGTIAALVGAGGPRTIDAQLVNLGTLTLAQPLTLSHVSAAHTNSGTIDASAADFTLNQSGTAPSFANSGTVTIGSGHSWFITGGALNLSTGVGGAGTLSLNSVTANFATNVTNATTGFVATNATINGPGTLTNASSQTMSLKAVTFGATSGLDNQGTLIVNANVTLNGTFTTSAGSTLRLLADGTTGFSTFTSANSFTNNGLIELTTSGSSYSPTLAVAGSNTLTNAAGGTISTLVGAGGPRTIDAQLVNQGTITLLQPLTLSHGGAAHTNSGTIDASAADFTLNQTGTAPSFTNSGTVTIGTGRTWSISGGALNQNAGTIGGQGTLSLNGLTANFATNVTNATTGFMATNVTINGPGTLINASGQTMSLKAVTIAATSGLDNQGTLIANANVTVNGALTTNLGSTLRLLADGSTGFSTFTSANSFTNKGLIELTTSLSSYSPTLAVTGGNTLTNASGATIASLVGAGGPRTIDAQLVNQGTLTVAQPLTLAHASAAHTNSGTIDASAGSITVNQSGTTPSFSNSGTISVGAGRVLTINGGTFAQGGTLNGTGGVVLANATTTFNSPVAVSSLDVSGGTVAFNSNQTTGGLATSLVNTVVNGPGSLTNSAGQTLSIRAATFNNNLTNRGTLITDGASGVNAANIFSTDTGSTLRLLATGATGNSTFTVPAFTNLGAIEMTTSTSSYTTVLNVTGTGTLTNASSGSISSLVGTGGTRTISAQLVNQGVVTLNQPLVLNRVASAHSNAGTIDATNADLTVTQLTQGGTQATFDNTGSLTVGSGRTLSVSGGAFTTGTLGGTGTVSFNGTSATFNKPFSLPVLNVTGGALSFTGSQTTAGITMNLVSTTVSSAGFTNSVGQTLNARSVNFNTILINQGLLVTDGSTSVTGPNSFFSNAAGSTLLIQATGATGNSTFSAPSFTNAGSINMTTVTSSYTDVLTVGGGTGTLTNSAGAFITILPGTGGTRTINGLVNNQGDVTVRPGPSPAGTLQINGGLTHTGALNLEIGGLTASTGYSRVSVSGTATLRGTLNYALVNGYTPTKGDPFDILTATSVAGQFTIGTQPGGWANPLYLPIGAPTTLVRLTAP